MVRSNLLVTLGLCCNHADNGEFRGRCNLVDLNNDGETLLLESPWCNRSLKCELTSTTFRLGKTRRWHHQGCRLWVGNWTRNSVTVTPEVAADVLNFVLEKEYEPMCGLVEFWELIEASVPLTANDLLAFASAR